MLIKTTRTAALEFPQPHPGVEGGVKQQVVKSTLGRGQEAGDVLPRHGGHDEAAGAGWIHGIGNVAGHVAHLDRLLQCPVQDVVVVKPRFALGGSAE